EQAIHELIHTVAAQRDLDADGHALAQLEVGHALLGLADDRALAGDLAQVRHDGVDDLGIFLRLAGGHVDDDLVQLGDLHNALVAELLVQGRSDLVDILFFQTCHSLAPPLQFGAALAADADVLAVLNGVAHAGRLAALGADRHDLAGVDSALGLNDAALLALTTRLDVLGDHVQALDNDLALFRGGLQNLAGLALVLAGDDHNVVAGFNMKIVHSIKTSLQRFGSQAQDLGEAGVAQLAGDGSKDTGALGALVGHDDDGGVLIKTDVAAVVTAQAVLGTDDNGLDHIALLHGAAGRSLLDAADHDVADVGISLAGTAQYTEAH